jgi:hypothetical protein
MDEWLSEASSLLGDLGALLSKQRTLGDLSNLCSLLSLAGGLQALAGIFGLLSLLDLQSSLGLNQGLICCYLSLADVTA